LVITLPLDITAIARTLEVLVKIPLYAVLGETQGRIAFISTREGITNLWSMNYEGKDIRRLTMEPIASVTPVKPELPYIIFTKDVTRGRELHRVFYVDVKGGDEKLIAETEPMRIFSMSYDRKKVVFTGATMRGLGLYQVSFTGNWEKLLDLKVATFVTDVNDNYVVGFGNLRGDPRTFELFIYSYKTNEVKIYTPRVGSISKSPILLKNGKVLFESDFEGENKLYLYDVETNKVRELRFSGKDYYDFSPTEHCIYGELPDGKIWVIAKKNGREKLFIDGYEVPTPEGVIHGLPAFGDSYVFIAASNLVTPPRILRIDLKTRETTTLIDNRVPDDIAKTFGDRFFVKYKSFDGLEIPMYVITSNKAPKPGPTIVFVHGGPWSEVADAWRAMIISLVATGYHVLAPNFRGSTGYGEKFRTLDIGDPGGGDLEDVVYATKWGIENGITDKDRIAIMGYSYGGYMTYLALGKYPNIWRCGVAGAGIVDWEEMYELSDAIFKKFMEILFAGRKELFKDRSPIKYVERVKAPLCIIHPQNDTRTPLIPVIKYMTKLLALGRTFEAHIIPDMGHIISKVEEAVKILLPAIVFLKKYLES